LIQNGGTVGTIRDISGKGEVVLVTDYSDQHNGNIKYSLHQDGEIADIITWREVCNNPIKYIFVTKSGSVYIYQGQYIDNILTGR